MLDLAPPYGAARDPRGRLHVVDTATGAGPPWLTLCIRQLLVPRAALVPVAEDEHRCSDCIVKYKEAVRVKPAPSRCRVPPGRVAYAPRHDPPRSLGLR